MVFTGIEYALLLLTTFVAYWCLPARWTAVVLLVASVVFYATWSVPYLALLGASALIGYAGGLAIASGRSSSVGRGALVVSVTVLFGLLAYFKYADFLLDVWSAGSGRPHSPLNVILPLAISFYTFEITSYLIDVHRGEPAERSFLRFAVFVGFFPHLIAGPIIRARELLPQLVARAVFDPARTISGLELLTYGLVKKTIFADNLGVIVDRVYGNPIAAGGLDVLIATVAFGAQIFADFSGYTDIARGSARLLGIELPINFRAPYFATSLTDFWRRWHMTLSRWLRDYLYVSLGGNRRGRVRTYVNLLVTMTLGGLWHGASVTFVLWGAYHGLLLVAERLLAVPIVATSRAGRLVGLVATFTAVQVGWAIFRAGSWANLTTLAERVIADPLGSVPQLHAASFVPLIVLFYLLHGLAAVVRPRTWSPQTLTRPLLAGPALAAAIVLIVVFGRATDSFIYFQF